MWTIDSALSSESHRLWNVHLFLRIVPILRDIGLWGPKVQTAFRDMGVIGFADADIDAEMANDERAAADYDAARIAHITEVATAASAEEEPARSPQPPSNGDH